MTSVAKFADGFSNSANEGMYPNHPNEMSVNMRTMIPAMDPKTIQNGFIHLERPVELFVRFLDELLFRCTDVTFIV